MRLDEISAQALLTGVIPGSVVQVVACSPMGHDAVNLVFKGTDGRLQERMLFRSDEAHIGVAAEGRPWSLDGKAEDFKLGAEGWHLALVFVDGETVDGPHYIASPFDREPGWAETSVNLSIQELLRRGTSHHRTCSEPD